jgi:hypothetical protein
MKLIVDSFDFIVTTQGELPKLFERVSAGNYKIRDNIKAVYIKARKGSGVADINRFLNVGAYKISDILSEGDTAVTGVKILTNDCVYFFCEPQTQFDWEDIKCQWVIEKSEFIGENCQNIGDAIVTNIKDDTGDPTTGYTPATYRGQTLISSSIADGGNGGGLLKNWLFSGFGSSAGYLGDITNYLFLQNCILQGCQDNTIVGGLINFKYCKGNNFISVGNELTAGNNNSVIFNSCKSVYNLESLNDGYGMSGTGGSIKLFNDCKNINNIEINRFVYDGISNTDSIIFNNCKRFNNIEITDILYSFTGAANITGFDTCKLFSNIEIDSMGYSTSNTGTFTIFNNCKHFNNLVMENIVDSASSLGNLRGFVNTNFVDNFEIINFGANIFSFTNSAWLFDDCDFIKNGLVNGFMRFVTSTTGSIRVGAAGNNFSNIRIINCANSVPAATNVQAMGSVITISNIQIINTGISSTNANSAAFFGCFHLSSCYGDGSSGTANGKDYKNCSFISSSEAGGSGITYWNGNTSYDGQGTLNYSTNS